MGGKWGEVGVAEWFEDCLQWVAWVGAMGWMEWLDEGWGGVRFSCGQRRLEVGWAGVRQFEERWDGMVITFVQTAPAVQFLVPVLPLSRPTQPNFIRLSCAIPLSPHPTHPTPPFPLPPRPPTRPQGHPTHLVSSLASGRSGVCVFFWCSPAEYCALGRAGLGGGRSGICVFLVQPC